MGGTGNDDGGKEQVLLGDGGLKVVGLSDSGDSIGEGGRRRGEGGGVVKGRLCKGFGLGGGNTDEPAKTIQVAADCEGGSRVSDRQE